MRLALVVGTRNPGKLVEIRRIVSGVDLDVIPLIDLANAPDVDEDGLTYRENAVKKACTIATWSGRLTLADDSGLEVTALGGAPGVRTARFGGHPLTPRERCLYLLERLQGVPPAERHAAFRCVAVLADPEGHIAVWEGCCEGVIGHTLQGEGGFGYDPVFIVPELGHTLAELSPAEKDVLSHRARALASVLPLLAALTRGASWPEACESTQRVAER